MSSARSPVGGTSGSLTVNTRGIRSRMDALVDASFPKTAKGEGQLVGVMRARSMNVSTSASCRRITRPIR